MKQMEHFELDSDSVESNIIDSSNKKSNITITEYYSEDGGVTVVWTRPDKDVDYLAIIKDNEGDEVKMFFKDTISANCDNDCRYSFRNLINGRQYSLVISTVNKDGISDFSNKINFSPSYQTMKCNANGTCSLIKSQNVIDMDNKLNDIVSDQDATKEILARCQNMLDSKKNIYDINQIYDADGSFKNVKDRLQYPEHLFLPITKGPDSLEELVKHQLELGIVNINVHNKDMIMKS